MNNLGAIVLAAGKGSRMNAKDINKVAMPLAGKPMIAHSIALLREVNIDKIVVVVGFAKESVIRVLGDSVIYAEQKELLGTASAVSDGLTKLPQDIKTVMVMYGDDSAFYTQDILNEFISKHFFQNADLSFLTLERENNFGFGRIIRDNSGTLQEIVEEKNATEEQKKIKEINAGLYIFNVEFLRKHLPMVQKNELTGEFYLTDLIGIGLQKKKKVLAVLAGKLEWWGINTVKDLEDAHRALLQVKR